VITRDKWTRLVCKSFTPILTIRFEHSRSCAALIVSINIKQQANIGVEHHLWAATGAASSPVLIFGADISWAPCSTEEFFIVFLVKDLGF
jgi:hypothetical protein